jgi:hypothetical protein
LTVSLAPVNISISNYAPPRSRPWALNPSSPAAAPARRQQPTGAGARAAMKKIFGAKKDKGPPLSIQDATERVSVFSLPISCCCDPVPVAPLLYRSSNCIGSWATGKLI